MKQSSSSNGSVRDRLRPPESDEIEISFFGPSYGECIAIHPGDGKWLIVDSCFAEDCNRPVALEYLERLGFAASTAIDQIIVTHWDDDHIGGLADLLRSSTNATLVISAALFNEELFTLMRAYRKYGLAADSGIEEISVAFDLMAEREKKPVLAQENMIIWSEAEGTFDARAIALSPSSALVLDGHLYAGTLVQSVSAGLLRFSEPTRNGRSIALLVEVGGRKMLFGGDLENVADRARGWLAVIDSKRWHGRASTFKVPHHGSQTGQCESVWTELLDQNPVTVVTPWKLGGRIIPNREEVKWLVDRSDKVYVTAIPQKKRYSRSAEVRAMIEHVGVDLSMELRLGGHVRIRGPREDRSKPWNCELFCGARHVHSTLCKAFPPRAAKSRTTRDQKRKGKR